MATGTVLSEICPQLPKSIAYSTLTVNLNLAEPLTTQAPEKWTLANS